MTTFARMVGDFGQPVTLVMAGVDLALSTAVIRFCKPDATVIEKTATIDEGDSTISYTIEEDFIDVPGEWFIQGRVLKDGGTKVTHGPQVPWFIGPTLEVAA